LGNISDIAVTLRLHWEL